MKNTVSMSIIYGVITLAAFILMIGYLRLIKEKEKWLQYLYISVFGINAGYFFISISNTLQGALFANRIVYLFSVFLPFFVMLTIMKVCKLNCPKNIGAVLFIVGCLMFLLAASGGYITLYYKDVSIDFINGATVLVKYYGPLHFLYGVYLFLYFIGMLGIILYTMKKKKDITYKLAMFFLMIVLGNILIWLIEQLIHIEFEFLTVFYLFTGALVLLLYMIVEEFTVSAASEQIVDLDEEIDMSKKTIVEQVHTRTEGTVLTGIEKLSVREMEVLLLIMDNKKRKDIAAELEITENTVKKHTSHIFSKLGISNRKELFEKCSHVSEQEEQ